MVCELGAPGQNAFVLGVEGQLRLADLDKGFPLVLATTCLEGVPLIEPLQEVANRVATGQQGVEVVLVQTLAFQQGDILVEEPIQRELHGVLGIVVLGDIQPKPSLIGFQIGQDRPVFRIDL